MYKKYLVLFLSKDYYTCYDGHAIVNARTENEAIKKAAKKLNIKSGQLNHYLSNKPRFTYCWVEVEKI